MNWKVYGFVALLFVMGLLVFGVFVWQKNGYLITENLNNFEVFRMAENKIGDLRLGSLLLTNFIFQELRTDESGHGRLVFAYKDRGKLKRLLVNFSSGFAVSNRDYFETGSQKIDLQKGELVSLRFYFVDHDMNFSREGYIKFWNDSKAVETIGEFGNKKISMDKILEILRGTNPVFLDSEIFLISINPLI